MGQIGSSPLSPLCCEPQCGVPVANGSPAWTGNIGIGIVKIGDYLESVNSLLAPDLLANMLVSRLMPRASHVESFAGG